VEGYNFTSGADRSSLQRELTLDWHLSLDKNFEQYETADMEIKPVSINTLITLIVREVFKDFLWVAGSVVVVFIYLCFHLRSISLSIPALLMILLSFPVSAFIYYYIF
jgi:hypothetical protein